MAECLIRLFLMKCTRKLILKSTSAMHPLTLEATDTRRGFLGFLVNGELATKERTLTLSALDGIAAYTVEPLYASGTTLIVR